MPAMERVSLITEHALYQEQFALLQEAEKDRVFCRHTMEHFLDVARIMYIFLLEQADEMDESISKEIIYAAALLHDIGRYRQISEGIPHHIAGAELAGRILPDCGFTKEETSRIRRAITEHRQKEAADDDPLSRLLYRADKLSRNCFCCPSSALCNWPEEKKNHGISC